MKMLHIITYKDICKYGNEQLAKKNANEREIWSREI